MRNRITSLLYALSAISALLLASCEPEQKPEQKSYFTVTPAQRYAWYDENPEQEAPSLSVSTEPIRLSFYGWGLDEDSLVKVNFPEKTTDYRRAILTYRMGGWNEGPADWDMTTMIMIRDKRTGNLHEFVRAFTPYGHYFDADWEKKYYIDITEYIPMLTGETEFLVYYGGWDATDSRAHSVTLTFDFYEGTPEKNTIFVQNIYDSRSSSNIGYRSWAYGVTDNDIEDDARLGKRTVSLPEGVKSLLVKVAISGHGHDKGKFTSRSKYTTKNAAEFDDNYYDIVINDSVMITGRIFYSNRYTYPQAGTYSLDRANWGPGLPLNTHYWNITNLPEKEKERTFTFDINLLPFQSQINDLKGEGVANYIIEVDIFGYDK